MEASERVRVHSIITPSEHHIPAIQELDRTTWKDGFQHYDKLYQLYPEGITVALADNGTLLGYIAAERLTGQDLTVGAASDFKRSLPPWNHDPDGWHKPYGSVLYILGHAVLPGYWRRGVSELIMPNFMYNAENQRDIDTVAVIYHLRHPTLSNPLKFWGNYGFRPLLETYDPNWKVAPDKTEVGAIVWARNVRRPSSGTESET